ncbi:hypothetical protein ACKI2C_46860, partial [Streptomyces brasiliscabiei]
RRPITPKERRPIVAKDKSKKSGGDEFAKPSEAPAGGDGFTLTSDENRGKLLLITPLRTERIEDKFSKEPGATKEIIVADVVVLDEKKPAKSEEHEEVYVFSGYLKGALRGYIGERRVLGRLTNTEDTSKKKDRGNYYWELEDADADDVAVARAYLEALNNPLAKISKDEKPAKKGKKSKPEPEPEPAKKKSKKK